MIRDGLEGVSAPEMGRITLTVIEHCAGELVEAAAEQNLPWLAVVTAIGVVDEAEPAVGADPGDELALGIDHRAIARLARANGRLGLLLLGDVALDGDMMGDAPIAIPQRRDGRVLIDQLAVLATIDDPSLPGAALPQALVDGVEERGAVSATMQHVPNPPTQNLGRVESRELGKCRVDIGAAAAGVGDLDLIAHLIDGHGQERQLLLAPALLGDVGGEQHAPTVRHAALADADPAAVDHLVLQLEVTLLARLHPLCDVVLAHVRMVDRAQLEGRVEPFGEAHAESQHLTHVVGHVVRIAAVVEDEPVLAIEDREAVGDAFRSGQEPRLGLAALGDVGGQHHSPAIGHRRLADPHPAAIGMLVLSLAQRRGVATSQPCRRIVRAHVGVVDWTTCARPSRIQSSNRMPRLRISRNAGGSSSGWRLL